MQDSDQEMAEGDKEPEQANISNISLCVPLLERMKPAFPTVGVPRETIESGGA